VLAGVAASLEKFATEIRGLQRTDILEAEEPFDEGGQTGSSSMPHKRNPELCERVCGIARTLRGYAVTGLENVALWHERDISHSSAERIILPDATGLLDYALHIFTGVMDGLVVYPERMQRNLERTQGLIYSSKVLNALIESGLKREAAYEIVKRTRCAPGARRCRCARSSSRPARDDEADGRAARRDLRSARVPDAHGRVVPPAGARGGGGVGTTTAPKAMSMSGTGISFPASVLPGSLS
jgi:adenylosuccinate lyase